MERRRDTGAVPPTERRRGDRRRGQQAVLHFRRADDRRMDAGQAAALLQRRALDLRTGPPAGGSQVPVQVPAPRVVDLVERVVDLGAPATGTGRCPECGVPCDELWLVRHWVQAH